MQYDKKQEPASVLVVDPPWRFDDKLPGKGRGAEKHYPTMHLHELCALELPPMLPDCWLFMWRVASMQDEALRLIKAWDFGPVKTELVWLKKTKTGKRWFGMGHTLRAEHETCLIAKRGRPQVLNRSTRSTFEAKAGRHSEKPGEFFEIVEALCPGPYVELFARQKRPGWACYGNEV